MDPITAFLLGSCCCCICWPACLLPFCLSLPIPMVIIKDPHSNLYGMNDQYRTEEPVLNNLRSSLRFFPFNGFNHVIPGPGLRGPRFNVLWDNPDINVQNRNQAR